MYLRYSSYSHFEEELVQSVVEKVLTYSSDIEAIAFRMVGESSSDEAAKTSRLLIQDSELLCKTLNLHNSLGTPMYFKFFYSSVFQNGLFFDPNKKKSIQNQPGDVNPRSD